ncbi:MAG: hypothetical protein F4240_08345 [Acidimicrobiia bacterium]|nr:hypothetical protein [Acidimicrobiia bacterium]
MFRVGGAVMVIAALMSWLESHPDARPNVAGVGPTTAGAGLVVMVVGLLLLLRRLEAAAALGAVIGGFTAALIFIVRVETIGEVLASGQGDIVRLLPDVGVGAWIGVVSSAVALLGAAWHLKRADSPVDQNLELLPALSGAVLAVIAPVLLTWDYGFPLRKVLGRSGKLHTDGLDTGIMTGYPIIILGSFALLAVLVAMSSNIRGGAPKQGPAVCIRVAGTAIVLLAGMEIAARLMGGIDPVLNTIWSGPIVALAGGVVMIRSVQPAQSE